MAIRAQRSTEYQALAGSPEQLPMFDLNGHHNKQHTSDDHDDVDNESDGGDQGERVLLGSGRKQSYISVTGPMEESTWLFVRGILLETIPTTVLMTVGLTFTGELLQQSADWRAMERVNELYILIPMLISLKGIIEMNLSTRLSTSANIGDLDDRATRRELLLGNLCLLQVQALLASTVAAILSFLLGFVISPVSESRSYQSRLLMHKRHTRFRGHLVQRDTPKSGLREFILLLSTATASASITSFVLGSFMCALILLCRRWRRDPDNITPPIASCLGDLLTLCIVGLVASFLVRSIDSAIPSVLVVLLSIGTVFAVMATLRNESVRPLIYMGWTPLLASIVISSGTGMVLDRFVDQYQDYGLLSIVLGGLPGSVGSVLVSRLSTSLHLSASNPSHHAGDQSAQDTRMSVTIITLFLVTLPVLGLFLAFISVFGWAKLPLLFIVLFVVIFCCAVYISLFVSKVLTLYLWRRDFDPDVYALAIQTSVVDLLGQLLLVLCFEIAQALGANVKTKS